MKRLWMLLIIFAMAVFALPFRGWIGSHMVAVAAMAQGKKTVDDFINQNDRQAAGSSLDLLAGRRPA